nr:ribonuclease HII [Kocuria palustris]
MAVSAAPTLDLERSLLHGHPGGRAGSAGRSVEDQGEGPVRIAGMDEVGRGALAGPVAVGAVVVDRGTRPAPAEVRDSKLLRPGVREALVPQIRGWARASAVGMASAAEIDAAGIVGALRLAGRRALAGLGEGARPDLVLLDGSHDWLSAPADLLALAAPAGVEHAPEWDGPVHTVVKGDMTCASIAAASVLAKVARDALMTALDAEHPAYGWASNKGYGAAAHRAALAEHGASDQHRRSWNLRLPPQG